MPVRGLGGFMQGFTQTYALLQQAKNQREALKRQEEYSKLQGKLIEAHLEDLGLARKQKQEQQGISGLMAALVAAGTPTKDEPLGMPAPAPFAGQPTGTGQFPAVHAEGASEGYVQPGFFQHQVPDQAAMEARGGALRGLIAQMPPAQVGPMTTAFQKLAPQSFPPPQEPFTLGPGQTRFGPTGQPIASGPPKEAPEAKLPTQASLAERAATGDPVAIKALGLLQKATGGSLSLNEIALRYVTTQDPQEKETLGEVLKILKPAPNYQGRTLEERVAQARFAHKNNPTPETKTELDQAEEALKVAHGLAMARGAGGAGGKLDVELGAPLQEKHTEWVHPDTLMPASPMMTKTQAMAAGLVHIQDAKARDRLFELPSVDVIIQSVDAMSAKLNTEMDWVAANARGAKLSVGSLLGFEGIARTYNDTKKEATGVFSRSLGGEKGVLTDRDIERVVQGMPRFTDTKRVRDAKVGIMNLLMDTAVEAQKSKILSRPYDRKKIRQKVDTLLDALEHADATNGPDASSFKVK